jgi:hypothetical protein
MPASIDVHAEDVARRAVRRLIYRIEHPDEPRVRITVAPDIVEPGELASRPDAAEQISMMHAGPQSE